MKYLILLSMILLSGCFPEVRNRPEPLYHFGDKVIVVSGFFKDAHGEVTDIGPSHGVYVVDITLIRGNITTYMSRFFQETELKGE